MMNESKPSFSSEREAGPAGDKVAEYGEVSRLAVIAAVCGFVSLGTVFWTPFLLLSMVGFVLAVVALLVIRVSSLLLPIILSTTRTLSDSVLNKLLTLFVAAVFVGTLFSFSEYLGVNNYFRSFFGIPVVYLFDIREISLFVSHIRFSLMICFFY